MKVIPFTIPVPSDATIHTQHEVLPHFYEHLHRHREFQLTYIIKGSGSLLAGSQLQPFQEGDFFLLGANLPHVFKSDPSYFERRKKGAVEAWSIFFDPKGPLQHVFNLPEMQTVQRWMQHYAGGSKVDTRLALACRPLVLQLMQTKGTERLVAFIQLLKKLASGKQRAITHEVGNLSEAEGQRMNSIIQFSTRHFSRTVTIDEVAQLAHMTPPAFCRYFKKHTRKTYINFLNEVRIHEASRRLMMQGMGNMASIAWDCGFNNVPNFNRVFKKVMHCTPGEFVKKSAV